MERKIDLDNLDDEKLNNLRDRVSEELTKINDTACNQANKLLERFGAKAIMQLKIVSLDEYEQIQKEKLEKKEQ